MRLLAIALAFLMLAGLASRPAAATACFNPELSEPCMAFWRSDAVFLGRAAAVQKLPGNLLSTRFEVVEAFRGISGPEVEVETGSAEQAFGYEFTVGESYMIYAFRASSGKLGTSICRGTGPLARTGEDLAYARLAAADGPRTSVIGRVVRKERPALDKALTITPIAGIPVTVEGSGGRWFSAVTDAFGNFAVTGPDAGTWTVRAEMPSGQPPAAPLEVQVPAEACAWTELEPTTLGTVRGRLLDIRGRPAAGRWIYLAPAAGLPSRSFPVSSEAVETDGQGRWTVGLVPEGEYVVLVSRGEGETNPLLPPVFFPGTREREKAGRVRVEVSKETRLEDFRLPPPLVPRRVFGVLRWSDGRPVDGVRVSLRETGAETNVMTDADGSFELSGFEGRAYELVAACTREGGALETERRKLKPGNGEVRLELALDRRAPMYGKDDAYWLVECPEPGEPIR